jgi:thiamine pyrophosphate-dependent acetolactate synthase large subunit-like protein
MNGYEVMAQALKAEGVEFLAAFPAQRLIDVAAKAGIRPIICRQERAGVNIADGFSRVTNGRRIGVFTMQQGPGAENAFGGVAQAYADSIPLLVLPGGEPLHRRGIHPTFDAVPNYSGVTKWAAAIHRPEDITAMVRRAFAQLKYGRPGPVLLEMPTDVMLAEVPEGATAYTPVPRFASAASSEDVRDLVTALLKASDPIINAGHGLLFAEATPELIEFAELTHIPVMTTLAGKSGFPENHPLSLGTGGISRTMMVHRFLESTDFVLGIGTSFTVNTFTAAMPRGIPMAQVTNCAEDINKDYDVAYGAIGDAKIVLRQMIEEVKRQLGSSGRADVNGVVDRISQIREEWMAQWEPHFSSNEAPISPYRVIRELELAVDIGNTIITHDSGYPREQLLPFWRPTQPRGYLGWGKSTQLGYGLGLDHGRCGLWHVWPGSGDGQPHPDPDPHRGAQQRRDDPLSRTHALRHPTPPGEPTGRQLHRHRRRTRGPRPARGHARWAGAGDQAGHRRQPEWPARLDRNLNQGRGDRLPFCTVMIR